MSDKDNNKEEDKLLYCSFCGKNQNEVRIVVKCSDRLRNAEYKFQRHASLENAKRTDIGRTYT